MNLSARTVISFVGLFVFLSDFCLLLNDLKKPFLVILDSSKREKKNYLILEQQNIWGLPSLGTNLV